MTDFRIDVRLKPGSMLESGAVIDYRGDVQHLAAFIPDNISPTRKGILGKFGWCKTPSRYWPSMTPTNGVTHICKREWLSG